MRKIVLIWRESVYKNHFKCNQCGADVCFYGAEKEPKATSAWNRRVDNAGRNAT